MTDIGTKALALRVAIEATDRANFSEALRDRGFGQDKVQITVSAAEARALASFLREAAEGWRPIETAPSTGEHVLVFGGRHVEPEYVRSDGEWWRLRAREGSTQQPTHWRPLPTPPAAGGGDAE